MENKFYKPQQIKNLNSHVGKVKKITQARREFYEDYYKNPIEMRLLGTRYSGSDDNLDLRIEAGPKMPDAMRSANLLLMWNATKCRPDIYATLSGVRVDDMTSVTIAEYRAVIPRWLEIFPDHQESINNFESDLVMKCLNGF